MYFSGWPFLSMHSLVVKTLEYQYFKNHPHYCLRVEVSYLQEFFCSCVNVFGWMVVVGENIEWFSRFPSLPVKPG